MSESLTSFKWDALPVVGQEMQESPVRNHSHVTICALGNLLQRPPRFLCPRRQRLQRGFEDAAFPLVCPIVSHAAGVDLVAKLGSELVLAGARVAWGTRYLLQGVEQDDGVQGLGPAKGQVAGVDCSSKRRGDELGESGVARERGAEVGALLLAEGGQIWIPDRLVFDRNIVKALGVADEVDCRCHLVCVLVCVLACVLVFVLCTSSRESKIHPPPSSLPPGHGGRTTMTHSGGSCPGG